MTKVKRTVTINHTLDEAISLLAVENNESYSGYVESRLLMNDNIKNNPRTRKTAKIPKNQSRKIQGQQKIQKVKRMCGAKAK